MGTEDPAFLNEHPVEFQSRVVQDGYAYWRLTVSGNQVPARPDIVPAEIPRLLAHVVLLDVQRVPQLDFRYRLVGTTVVEHLFSDYTGTWFSQIEHQRDPSGAWENCRRVALSGRPLLANTEYVGPHQGFRRAEDVILPLAEDGTTVDSLLLFIQYMPKA